MVKPVNVKKRRIRAVLCEEGAGTPLGSYWQFRAAKADFYLEPIGKHTGGVHLSVHGPKEGFDSHRFHVKVVESEVERSRENGAYLEHSIPKGGKPVSGRRMSAKAFQVARIRWMPSLRNPAYRDAARSRQSAPQMGLYDSGAMWNGRLKPGAAWDLQVYLSYGEPYWPTETGPRLGNPRLGPLSNQADMHLTILSTQRYLVDHPTPAGLLWDEPEEGQKPTQILSGGADPADDIYWWVEMITAEELLIPN